MERRTWPSGSDGHHIFSTLHFPPQSQRNRYHTNKIHKPTATNETPTPSIGNSDFSSLPYDLLTKIAASFTITNLWSASMVCRSWREGLKPLREAMVLVRWGKRFKHGTAGVRRNSQKALDSFLKGVVRGSSAAMVDAGLLYWEMGKKEEGIALYKKAAMLGDPAGQCNLGISYLQDRLCCDADQTHVASTQYLLQRSRVRCVWSWIDSSDSSIFSADPPNPEEAVKWFYRAATVGHVRAQYSLALCLQQGRGIKSNMPEAAKWYLRAAEGGNVRAMYNTALCYSSGEGFLRNNRQSKKWMKLAAEFGNSKAQYEHGLSLFSEGDKTKALVYLELASRAGETAATCIKSVLLQQLPPTLRDCAMLSADNWQALRRLP